MYYGKFNTAYIEVYLFIRSFITVKMVLTFLVQIDLTLCISKVSFTTNTFYSKEKKSPYILVQTYSPQHFS